MKNSYKNAVYVEDEMMNFKNRILCKILLFVLCLFVLVGCDKDEEEILALDVSDTPSFHIGIVTGSALQSEDEMRSAEAMIQKYGNVENSGMVRHLVFPDNFMEAQNETIKQITSLADDALMKVVVVNPGVPGTAEAFRQIKAKNSEIICLVANIQEDPRVVEEVADMIVDPDNLHRGYLIPIAAQKMGAKNFVHISFPRHLGIELISLRYKVMESTCKQIGLKFFSETVPDPVNVGIEESRRYILDNMPQWVQKYGKSTAFFATNDAQTEPLVKSVAELGAIFVEQDSASPVLGYSTAFDVDLSDVRGNWSAILRRVEDAVISNGGQGRMGSWAYSCSYTMTQALAEYGKQIVEGTMKRGNKFDLLRAFSIFTPGANWNGSAYEDVESKTIKENHILVYQDTYVFGTGHLGMTDLEVPNIYEMLEETRYR